MFIELLTTVFGILIWEHLGTLNLITTFLPSVFFNKIGSFLGEVWSFLGRVFANISSYLLLLKVEKIVETISNLLESLLSIVVSPFKFFSGYLQQALKWMGYNGVQDAPGFIWCGSTCLVLALSGVYMKTTNALSRWVHYDSTSDNGKTDKITFGEFTLWDRVILLAILGCIILGIYVLSVTQGEKDTKIPDSAYRSRPETETQGVSSTRKRKVRFPDF